MPSVSEKQRMMMAVAKYQPEKLYKRNVGVLKMNQKQLGEFARKKVVAGAKYKSHKKGY